MMRFTQAAWAAALLALAGGFQVPAAAQPGTQTPAASPQFVLGRWTDSGNCAEFVDFRTDGSFLTSTGAHGTWSLAGDRLTFQGSTTIVARLVPTGRDSLTLVHDDGSQGASTRCPEPRRVAMPVVPASAAEALRMSRPATAGFLAGSWTDDGDCSIVITFHSDGRFVVPNGSGQWRLAGDSLTFSGDASSATARARAVGNDRLLLIKPDGSIGQSMRCS